MVPSRAVVQLVPLNKALKERIAPARWQRIWVFYSIGLVDEYGGIGRREVLFLEEGYVGRLVLGRGSGDRRRGLLVVGVEGRKWSGQFWSAMQRVSRAVSGWWRTRAEGRGWWGWVVALKGSRGHVCQSRGKWLI